MPTYFCLSTRFLQPFAHGRRDYAEPEWPPSPLRAFQSLLAAAAGRWNERTELTQAAPALRWLESQPAPQIVAAEGLCSDVKCLLYVPDNTADLAVPAWKRGEVSASAKRVEKVVRPTHLAGDAVHFLYALPHDRSDFDGHFPTLEMAACSVTHLGWGIDMVVGNASILSEQEAAELPGQRWLPTEDASANGYRIPIAGTLDALTSRHQAFLNRIGRDAKGNEHFNPVPPLTAFRVVGYRKATDPAPRQVAAFSILKPDASGFRPFDVTRRIRDVAGMVRCAVAHAADDAGWSNEKINVFVHGKTPDGAHPAGGEKSPDRFLYLPLPTLNAKLGRVESVRRVVIAAPTHCREEIAWVKQALSGEELKNDNDEVTAVVTLLPGSDWVLRKYVDPATSWATVTPVILPRHDRGDANTAESLLKKAFEHSGYAMELIERTAIEFRRVGYLAGVDLASRYLPPENISHKPRYHVRIRFPHPIPGPVVVGAGRFRGFGLFASIDQ